MGSGREGKGREIGERKPALVHESRVWSMSVGSYLRRRMSWCSIAGYRPQAYANTQTGREKERKAWLSKLPIGSVAGSGFRGRHRVCDLRQSWWSYGG